MRHLPPWAVGWVTTGMRFAERTKVIHPLKGTGLVARRFRLLPDVANHIKACYDVPDGSDVFDFIHHQRLYESKYSLAREILDKRTALTSIETKLKDEFTNPEKLAAGLSVSFPTEAPRRALPYKLFNFDMLLLLVAIIKIKADGGAITKERVQTKIDELYSANLKGAGAGAAAALRTSTAFRMEQYLIKAKMLAEELNYDYLGGVDELPFDVIFDNKPAHLSSELGQPTHSFLHHGVFMGNGLVVDVWNRMFDEANESEIVANRGDEFDLLSANAYVAPATEHVSTSLSESTVSVRPIEEFVESCLVSVSPTYFTPYTSMYDHRLLLRRAIWTIGRFPHYNVERENCESHTEWVFDNHTGAPKFCMLRSAFDSAEDLDTAKLREFYSLIFKPLKASSGYTDLLDMVQHLIIDEGVPFDPEFNVPDNMGGGGRRKSRAKRQTRRRKSGHRRSRRGSRRHGRR